MRSQACYGALLVQISDPLSHTLHGWAVVVQHVRVIPAKLLNFGFRKATVYSYCSIVKHGVVKDVTLTATDQRDSEREKR